MKGFFLYVMAVLYIIAGSYHFINPRIYSRMMPTLVPWHRPIVYISGAVEIILAILLIPVVTRVYAAWGVILLLIVIFPANIQMMLNFYRKRNPYLWITILRLPLQLVLIWWAWLYTF
ncbi:MAG: DoxX family protein [Bacteroidetes bacterium]|nr:DoxX family protein [Bacteroidota bacterium]MBS1607565.1 DoxX family protein [Bacteroidota bacterium]